MKELIDMKIVAIVILYDTNIVELKKNILSYIDYVEKIIIWDNGSNFDQILINENLKEYEYKIIYKTEYKNKFIAYPLNQALKWAIDNDYEYLLSMDQDSLFDGNDISKYFDNIIKMSFNESIAIYGVNPNNYYLKQKDLVQAKWFITSGSVYDVNIIRKIGGFREDYEIDCVDNEICYKANSKGYKCLIDTNCNLIQQFGTPVKSVFGFTSLGYSPFRTYSILCNHIRLWKEYPDYVDNFLRYQVIVKEFFLYRIIKVILAENQKIKKLRAIFLGFLDGLSGKRKERKF